MQSHAKLSLRVLGSAIATVVALMVATQNQIVTAISVPVPVIDPEVKHIERISNEFIKFDPDNEDTNIGEFETNRMTNAMVAIFTSIFSHFHVASKSLQTLPT
jgi:hypothetical protein